MTGHDRAFAVAELIGDFRLPATDAGLRHWIAETVFTDAPFGSIGENAQRARLAESIPDRRARVAIEGGICHRHADIREADRRYRRRSW